MPELFDGTSGDSQRVNLSRWIEQAVSKGQYTSEKITTLRAQRQRVVELVANAESEVSQQELKMIQRRPSVKHNSTGNHGPNRTAATVQQTPEETVLGTSSSSDLDRSGTTSTPGLRLQPECEYKTCQICRPYAKDRAWQCFGHALNPSASLSVIEISNDNRPISNATLVRRIGLWQPNSGPRQSESFGDIALADDADGDQSKMIASRRSNGLQSESRTKSPIGSHTTTGQVIDGKASLSHRDSKLGRDSKDSSLSWLDKGKWKADGDGPERTECRNRLRKNFTGEDQLALKFGRGKKPCHQDYSLMNNDEYIIRNGKDQEIRVQDGLVGKEEGVDLGIADIIVEG
ncbi:hypothetical protein MMC19_007487 [Ptychographa xylographoides]|nr:hypothetical protein [Ptychographa xylographoides]